MSSRPQQHPFARQLQIALVLIAAVAVLVFAGFVAKGNSAPPSGSGASAAATPGARTTPTVVKPPVIPNVVTVDFQKGDQLPAGSKIYDTGLNSYGMTVKSGGLYHGPPTAKQAASYLEKELPQDVRRLGATAQFTSGGGGIAMIAWKSSLVDARRANQPVPLAGIHFVAYKGQWHLGAFNDGETILGQGSYDYTEGPQKFEVYRKGNTAWVVTPDKAVTKVTDARIGEWAGRFACWELYENSVGPDFSPARFLAVSAG